MIRLTSATSCTTHYVAARNIARITEAGASSQWHGIKSIVRTFDGQTLECRETANEIFSAIAKAEGGDA